MTDPELQAAMQVLSVLTPAAYSTDFNLYCLLLCRMVNAQPAAWNERRFRGRLWLFGAMCSARSFTATTKGIVSPSLPATWSTSTASSEVRRRLISRWQRLASGRSQSRPPSISAGRPFVLRFKQVI